jgi:glutaredoxin
VQAQIDENPVIIYSLKEDEICTKTKEMLQYFNVSFMCIDLDLMQDRELIEMELKNLIGEDKQLPYVFVAG